MKTTRILLRVDPLFNRCPSCKTPHKLKYSHSRNWWEAFVKRTTFFKLCRCENCGWRGFLSALTMNSKSYKYLFIYIGLIIIVAFLVTLILKKVS
jgi:hypothetical protein